VGLIRLGPRKGEYRNCWSAVASANMSTLPPAPPAPGPPPWPHLAPSRPQRWPVFASLVVALVAIGLAIGSWFRPPPSAKAPPTPAYTNQQTADAKETVCAAFAKVDHALDISARNTGDDSATKLAVATSGRQVLDAGSRYLLTKLVEEPAAPPEVAKEVRKFADSSQELVIGYLDGLTNSDADLQPSLSAGDETTLTIRRLCK
jgi:hypothetical protein